MKQQEFYWTARLFIDGKLIESKYFDTKKQRDNFVSLNKEWKKRGKICARNIDKHKKEI